MLGDTQTLCTLGILGVPMPWGRMRPGGTSVLHLQVLWGRWGSDWGHRGAEDTVGLV